MQLKIIVEDNGRNRKLDLRDMQMQLRLLLKRTEDIVTGLRDLQVLMKSSKSVLVLLRLTSVREPRGFGFVQYFDPADAADAKYYMDGQVVLGREIAVVFAQENRKKPAEMRTRESSRGRSRGRSYDRRYSPSPRGRPSYRGRSYSRSPSPRYSRRRFREESYSRSPADSRSRSPTPSDGRYRRSARRERSVSVSE
ncbi:hypothetical protein ACQ4PT_004903 [Festuca glaucescens]